MVLQNIGRMGGKGNCVLAWLEYVVGTVAATLCQDEAGKKVGEGSGLQTPKTDWFGCHGM